MTRGSRFLTLAIAVVMATAAPAAAFDVAVDGAGIVHAGYYPDPAGGLLSQAEDLDAHAAAAGKRVTFAGTSMDVTAAPGPDAATPGSFNTVITTLDEFRAGEATPFINLFVGDASTTAIVANASIDGLLETGAPTAKTVDEWVTRWAGYLKRWLEGESLAGTTVPATGRTAVIAPLPEMNVLGGESYQCQASSYAAAYERIVDLVEGVLGPASDQVRWAFAPNNETSLGCASYAAYWPDPAKVDFTAVSAYNLLGVGASPDTSPADALDAAVAELKGLAPTKPIIVAQTASCSSNPGRAAWISDLFGYVAAERSAVGLVWYNVDEVCDWRIWDGSAVDASWATSLTPPLSPDALAAEWFVPDTTLVVPTTDTPDPCPDAAVCDSVAVIEGSGPRFTLRDQATLLAPKTEFIYGNPGDVPLMGDWDCDGVDTPGMYRSSNGLVYLRNSNTPGVADRQFFLGNPGDLPLAGDFNGDGCDTVSVYRPATQQFFIANRLADNNAGIVADFPGYVFGNPGDKPFAGDLDGDGSDEVALHRESSGFVYYRTTLTTGFADAEFYFGNPGDLVEAGDWNGDGTDTVALYRPATGRVFLKLANTQGNADFSFFVGFGKIGFTTGPSV